MSPAGRFPPIPIQMASIRQLRLSGELILDQNDGTRRLYWSEGELIYLQSDVAGEQFGNYLLRRGVIDLLALNQLLTNPHPPGQESYRLGEKIIQSGLMTIQERDEHLQRLQEQVMIHCLEHGVVDVAWNPGPMAVKLSKDLHFRLDHRHFIWNTFQEATNLSSVCQTLETQRDWTWEGQTNLLETLSDLPLNPTTAYALSFLGTEPMPFDTFLSLSQVPKEDAARLIISLWALGALTLTQRPPFGMLPTRESLAPPPEPVVLPLLDPEVFKQRLPELPSPPPQINPFESVTLPSLEQPEFLELEASAPPPKAPEPPPVSAPVRAKKLLSKAKQLLLQERRIEAVRTLEQAAQLDADPDQAYGIWLLLGQLRMENPAWSTRAIDALQSASRIQPTSAEPWATMGEIYFRKGFRTNAVACFHRALELDPSVPIPPDVDLGDPNAALASAPAAESLFTRFKTLLKGTGGGSKI